VSSRFALPRTSAYILLVFIYYLAAAASFGGFFIKWHFSETTEYSLSRMLDGTAEKPFVYRQLLPMIANKVDGVIPQRAKTVFLNKLAEEPPTSNPIQRYFPGATDATEAQYALRYFLVYGMSFLSMFGAMFAIRAACIEVSGDRIAATLTPLVIAAIFPLIQTEGGYYYDNPELLFMALGIWLVLRRWLIPLVLVTVLGTLNKESFLLVVLTLYPFMAMRYSRKLSIVLAGGLLAIAAAVNLLIKYRYLGNSGPMMAYMLMPHLQFLVDPRNYFRFEINYGILTTKGFNVLHLLLVALLLKTGWRRLMPAARTHAWIALVITAPLFIAFCYRDELRNLSLLTMTLAFLICTTISAALSQAATRGRRDAPLLQAGEAGAQVSADPAKGQVVAS
jgi:hypothetical protein